MNFLLFVKIISFLLYYIAGLEERQVEGSGGEEMLKDVSTKELVEELKTREGVSAKIAEPYQDLSVKVNGPAIVMVIID